MRMEAAARCPVSFLAATLAAGLTALSAIAGPADWRTKERWRGFNLEGYALQGSFSGKVDEQDLAWMHELGFNFARIMVDYHYIASDGDWKTPDPAKCGFIDRVFELGRRHRIHTQLCLSIPPGVDYKVTRSKACLFDDPVARQTLVDYWRFLARRYRERPNDEVSFNLFNEPNAQLKKGDEYVTLIARCLEAIHAEAPDRFVIADGHQSGRLPEPRAVNLPCGQSIHVYEPMGISHYRAEWCRDSSEWSPSWPLPPVCSPVCGALKPPEARGPIIIHKLPACHLSVVLGIVNRHGEFVVRANGTEIFRRYYRPAKTVDYDGIIERSGGEFAGIPKARIELDLPETARLELGMDRGDWIVVREIAFEKDGRRAVVKPEFNWSRSQQPRRDLFFAGFDAACPVTLADGKPYTGLDALNEIVYDHWQPVFAAGQFVMVGETGFYKYTPYELGLKWLEENLRIWQERGIGWALWNFRGPFGILDSGRAGVVYEDFHGHKLDRQMLDLLRRY